MEYRPFIFILFACLFLSIPAHAEPKINAKTHLSLAVVMAAGLSNLHGPVEYRPAVKTIKADNKDGQKDIVFTGVRMARSYERKADNKDLYSGSLLLANANP